MADSKNKADSAENPDSRDDDPAATIDSPLNPEKAKALTDGNSSPTAMFTPSGDASRGADGGAREFRITRAGERFKKLRRHAEGGLGEVFLAHDEQLNRVVALKEMKNRHARDGEKKARFLLEGEVTGSLEHPGIVPVYSMGQDDAGSPFYAMRFIRGQSMREAIRQFHEKAQTADSFSRNSLEFRRLLGRFVAVCNAVAFAHDRGVLHRDIKPENVMLGEFGETLVVDWGMARVSEKMNAELCSTVAAPGVDDVLADHMRRLDAGERVDNESLMAAYPQFADELREYFAQALAIGQLTQSESATFALARKPADAKGSASPAPASLRDYGLLTADGSALGTPAYMSPEVAAGKTNTWGPAIDVFSLGATLYCLLTNRPPFKSDSMLGVLRKAELCDYQVPADANSHVPRALSAICCRAMAFDPQQRYASPLELAGDVEKWLGDEAVSAYREPLPERVFRWARRHRTWALAGAASIGIISIVSIIAAGLINQQRERAVLLAQREAAARAEAVRRFAQSRQTVDRWLTGFSDAVQYYPGVQSFRDRMLEQAAEQYSQFAQQVSDDPDLELERGRTLTRLGDLRRHLLQAEAAQLAYSQAADVFSSLASRGSAAAAARLESANVKVRQGMLAADVGRFDDAATQYTTALDELEHFTGAEVDQQRLTQSRVDARVAYGSLLAHRGETEAAEKQLRRAVEEQSSLVRAEPTNAALIGPLAGARVRLGQLLLQHGDAQSALQEFYESINQLDRLVKLSADHPEPLESRAAAQINLASALRLMGRYDAETTAYRAAIGDYESLQSAMPDVPMYRENRALTETDLGQLLYEIGRPRDAFNVLTKAESELKSLAESNSEFVRFQEELAVCLDNLGQAQHDLGQLADALASHQAAQQILETLARDWPEQLPYQERAAVCRSHVGQVQAAMDEAEVGIVSLQSAAGQLELLQSLQPELASVRSALATTHGRRGDVYFDNQQMGEAEAAYIDARQGWKELVDMSPSAEYLHRAAWFETMCPVESVRDPALALEYARRAGEAAPENRVYLGTLAAAHARAGQAQEAIELLAQLSATEAAADRGRDLLFFALCHHQRGRADEARDSFNKAADWVKENRPGNAGLNRLRDEVGRLIDASKEASSPAPASAAD